MKVLILGDQFFKEDIVKATIEKYCSHMDKLEIISLSNVWPMEAFDKNDEISEFQGSEEEIIKVIGDVDVVFLHAAPLSDKVLEAGKNLKFIGVVRGGPKNINIEAATKRNIPVVNTPGRNAVAVVEFTIGLILAELKNIARAHHNLMNKNWRYDFYLYDECKFELTDKTIGLVGFGNVSYRLCPILKAFGMNIVSFDPYTDAQTMAKYEAKKVSFDQLLEISDIVSVHARLTPETTKMFNASVFEKMKPSALFVNTARGGLVDYDDLAKALTDKTIACAAMDCFEDEPVDFDSDIMKCDNITVTPHIAGATKDTIHYALDLILTDFKAWNENKPVKNCMNQEVLSQ